MSHSHTESTQPDDYRAHLVTDHGLELDDHPLHRHTTAKSLVLIHAKQHPDHEVLLPSMALVKVVE